MFTSLEELTTHLAPYLSSSSISLSTVQETFIDRLIETALFSSQTELQSQARKTIRELSAKMGIYSLSINTLYQAFGKEYIPGFTVPAINIRTLTYDTARIIFRVMQKLEIGPVIFEIARSEMAYTLQRPDEYAVHILAAAIKESYHGAVFIQGDHFQFAQKKFALNPTEEVQNVKKLCEEAINAQFYNIDIDASTLVDLEKNSLDEQQKNNYEVTAEMTKYIRGLQPKETIISIGGEIGHIGGKNSTVADFQAFMNGYIRMIPTQGISKVSVQTGTSHGGTPDAQGHIQQVTLDFSVLQEIGNVARKEYHLGGAVQHGASTLPDDLFHKFPEVKTLEIHLATGFQNIVYDAMPEEVRKQMYQWCTENLQKEREEGWSDEQFLYKTRKKALGPFKQQLWNLRKEEKQPILLALENKISLLFQQLQLQHSLPIVKKYYPQ